MLLRKTSLFLLYNKSCFHQACFQGQFGWIFLFLAFYGRWLFLGPYMEKRPCNKNLVQYLAILNSCIPGWIVTLKNKLFVGIGEGMTASDLKLHVEDWTKKFQVKVIYDPSEGLKQLESLGLLVAKQKGNKQHCYWRGQFFKKMVCVIIIWCLHFLFVAYIINKK